MTTKAQMAAQPDRRGSSDFPKHVIDTVLRVPQALEDNNGGNPLPPMEVALAVGMSPGSSSFRDLLSSSIKYGLTVGSFNQPKVSLEALGKAVVAPKDEGERRRSLLEAVLRPELFRRAYEHYRGKKVPEPVFFANTAIREFGVAKESSSRFVEVFIGGMQYLGLIRDTPTGRWLSAELPVLEAGGGAEVSPGHESETSAAGIPGPKPVVAVKECASKGDPTGTAQANAIFVGHGKDRVPLEQLQKILTEYHMPFKVAAEEANKGRPISQKVAETMNECGSAILIFTADEEFVDKAGNTVYRPSENVVFELGAASVLYGSRIIVFRESRVQFPTNFRDIGFITFEQNQLSAKVNELFRELIGFGLIKISVA
jgi:Predicted nucleotide-binding protein containing TIR-like domain